jgi:hypothetical protein
MIPVHSIIDEMNDKYLQEKNEFIGYVVQLLIIVGYMGGIPPGIPPGMPPGIPPPPGGPPAGGLIL